MDVKEEEPLEHCVSIVRNLDFRILLAGQNKKRFAGIDVA